MAAGHWFSFLDPLAPDRTQNRGLALLFLRWQKIAALVLHSRTRIDPQTWCDTLQGATNKTPAKKGGPIVPRLPTLGEGRKSGVPAQSAAVPTPYRMLCRELFQCFVQRTCFNRVYLHIAEPIPICVRVLNLSMDHFLSLYSSSVLRSENGGYIDCKLM